MAVRVSPLVPSPHVRVRACLSECQRAQAGQHRGLDARGPVRGGHPSPLSAARLPAPGAADAPTARGQVGGRGRAPQAGLRDHPGRVRAGLQVREARGHGDRGRGRIRPRIHPARRQVYNAVLRVLRAVSEAATPGKLPKQWQKEAEAFVEKELVELGLLRMAEIRKQDPDKPALKKYFMHGVGHPLGLDVHDVADTTQPIQEGWVLTVEPAIYIPAEGFAIRLENDILVQAGGNVDLMSDIPIEAGEVEKLMRR